MVGEDDGIAVGRILGVLDGRVDGAPVGLLEGTLVGDEDGFTVGNELGALDGTGDGPVVGAVGDDVGAIQSRMNSSQLSAPF